MDQFGSECANEFDALKLRVERGGLFKMSAGVWIVLVDPLDNTIEVESLSVVGALSEKFWSERARFVDVVAHDEGAKELKFDALIVRVVNKSLVEVPDGVFILTFVDMRRGERLNKQKRLGREFEAIYEGLFGLIGVV